MKQGLFSLAVSLFLMGCGFHSETHYNGNHIAPAPIGDRSNTAPTANAADTPKFRYSESQIEQIATLWSQTAVQAFEKIKSQDQIPTDAELCLGEKSENYFRSAVLFGRYEEVLQNASKCVDGISARSAFYAARAAGALGQRDLMLKLFDLALKDTKAQGSDKDGVILAWFMVDFDKAILNKAGWSADKTKKVFNALMVTNRMSIENGVNLDDCIQFLKNEILTTDGLYRDVFLNQELFRAMLAADDSVFEWAGDVFKKTEDPSWWRGAYRIVFATPDPIFKKARIIYDAANPYLNIHSGFPTEDNTYTYSELYATACKDSLLQDENAKTYFDLKAQWRASKLSDVDFFNAVRDLNTKFPNRADVLVTLATEAIQQNRLQDATDLAWKAHQACPYYNRSHWMLSSLDSARVLRSFPEFNDLEAQKKALVEKTGTPAEMPLYFLNWTHLTPDIQQNMTWSVHLWLKFVPVLAAEKFNSYIKFPFELLSEDPGMQDVKDKRADYYRDNRNWDDMRGAGGPQMITDYFQAPDAPYGNYNVTSHEMAHQVDSYMEAKMPKSWACLNKTFDAATARNDFLTDYSRNRPEYFAVGSESFAIPEGYPKRFGADKAWYDQHDPALRDFILKLSDLGTENENQVQCD